MTNITLPSNLGKTGLIVFTVLLMLFISAVPACATSVTSFDELKTALADTTPQDISVMNQLTVSGTETLLASADHTVGLEYDPSGVNGGMIEVTPGSSLTIDGNGYTLTLDGQGRQAADGGLIYVNETAGCSLTGNVILTGGNVSGTGGAVYSLGSLILENTYTGSITGNNADLGYGGGIYIEGSNEFGLYGGTIVSNSGGGVMTFSDKTFISGSCRIADDNAFENALPIRLTGALTNGGGVYSIQPVGIADNILVVDGSVSPASVDNFTLSSSMAGRSLETGDTPGSLYLSASSANLFGSAGIPVTNLRTGLQYIATNSLRSAVTAAESGDTLEVGSDLIIDSTVVIKGKSINITASTGDYTISKYFVSNTKYFSGGMFSIKADGSLTINATDGSTLTLDGKNTYYVAGGSMIGLDAATAVFTLEDGVTITNGAGLQGTAIFVGSGTAIITGGNITGNGFTKYGSGTESYGAIDVSTSGSLIITGGNITDNRGPLGGAMRMGGYCIMTGGTITNNTATSHCGDGIYFNTVYAPNRAAFCIGGTAVISADNEFYIWSSGGSCYTNITLVSPLTNGGGVYNINPDTTADGTLIVNGSAYGVQASVDNFTLAPSIGKMLMPGFTADTFKNLYIRDGTNVVGNQRTGLTYPTVYSAVTAAESGDTLVMFGNTVESSQIDIGSKVINITAFSGSYTINRSASQTSPMFTVDSGGSLTLTTENGAALTVDGQNVAVSDAGGLVSVSGGGSFLLEDGVTLTGGTTFSSHGGAVSIRGGSPATPSSFIMTGGIITGNRADTNGGAVFIRYSSFSMHGGTLSNNTAGYRGGAVFVYTSGSFTMTDGNITDNSATNTSTTQPNGGDGGAVIINGGSFTMSGGNITNNTAKNNGGAVYLYKKAEFSMNGGNITNNTAENNGNAIHIPDLSSTFSIQGSASITEDNDVYLFKGGPIHLTAPIADGKGVFNITPGVGSTSGDIIVNGMNDVTASADNFRLNTTYVNTNHLGLKQSGHDLILESMSVQNINTDTYYSTVYDAVNDISDSTTQYTLKIIDDTEETQFIEIGAKKINITADSDRTITKNISSPGALFRVGSGGLLCINATSDNLTIDGGGGVVPSTGSGGLISVGNGGTLTLETGVTLTNGTAASGGAVCVASSGTFFMTGGNITGNNAWNYGGGVSVESHGTFMMYNGTIAGNEVTTSDGGGVYVEGGTFTMYNGTITSNNATNAGGGASFSTDTTVTMYNGTIIGNNATYGGGVSVSGGTFTMSGGTITGNNAAKEGDGVYVDSYYSQLGTITMSGGVNITEDNDVFLPDGRQIYLAAPIADGKGAFNITPEATAIGTVIVNGTKHGVTASAGNFRLNATYAAATGYVLKENNKNLILSYPYPYITYDPANGESARTEYLTSYEYNATAPEVPVSSGYQFLGWYYYNGTLVYNTTDRLVVTTLQETDHNLTVLWKTNNSVSDWDFDTRKLTVTYAAANNLTTLPTGDSITFGAGAQNITFNITDNMTAVAYNGAGSHTLTNSSTNVTISGGDPAGLYTITYTGSYKGDANLDGVVDIVDATGLGVYTIHGDGGFTITSEEKLHGDVNRDGQLTVADVLALHEYLAKA